MKEVEIPDWPISGPRAAEWRVRFLTESAGRRSYGPSQVVEKHEQAKLFPDMSGVSELSMNASSRR